MEGQDMTDYTELVKALRFCARWHMADDALANAEQAAAAIEELKAIAHSHCVAASSYWEELEELKAQLPKRGEWVGVSPTVDTVQCSICGGQLFSAELETPYCPYCGAKMREVQDGKNET